MSGGAVRLATKSPFSRAVGIGLQQDAGTGVPLPQLSLLHAVILMDLNIILGRQSSLQGNLEFLIILFFSKSTRSKIYFTSVLFVLLLK